MNKRIFIALIITISLILAFPLIESPKPEAGIGGWSVTWTKVNDSISHKIFDIEVQNMNDSVNRLFYLGVFFKNTDFPDILTQNVYLYEWTPVLTNVPVFATNTTEKTCWYINELGENITWNCTITETYQNGTVEKSILAWKKTKMNFVKSLLNGNDSHTSQSGEINIPKLGSDCHQDDLNNDYGCNGTKLFRLEFDVPIINNTWGGYRSGGVVGFYDYNTLQEYHPFFNSSWIWRRNITINNTLNPNALYDYPMAFNISHEDAINPDFSDLRFTWLNTTPDPDEEIEIPYWIEKKVDGQWAYVWVKVKEIPASSIALIYVYFANPFATSMSNGKDVFTMFDDFDDGDLNLTIWTMVNNQTGSPIHERNGYLEISCNAGTDCHLSPTADSAPHVHLNLTYYQNYEFIGRLIVENYNETRHGMFVMNKSSYEDAGMILYERHNTTEGATNLTQEISSPDIGSPVDVESWNYNEFTFSVVRNGTNKVNLGYSSDVSGMNYIGDFNISADYAGFQGSTPNNTEGYSILSIDYAFVRNYSAPEPTYTIGEPEDDPPSFSTTEQMQREICKDASGNLHMVYVYNTTNIAYSKSTDGGVNWVTNISFYGGTSTSVSLKGYPAISCDGNNITIAYADATYYDIIVGVSEDNGNTWRFSTPVTSNGCRWANVERRGQNIYLVYNYGTATCQGSGTWEIWFIRSLDAGSTWVSSTRLMYHTTWDWFSVAMAVDGNGSSTDKVYIAGHYYPSAQYIYFINSTNAGANFPSCDIGSSPQCVQILTASGVANHPTITYYGSNIYVASHDTNAFEIWFTNSTNSGIAWTAQIRIDLTGATTAQASYPDVTIDNNGYPVVLWADNTTHSNFDIVFRRYNGTGWDSSLVYLTNDNDGNNLIVSAPYKYYNDNKIHYFYLNGTSSPYQIIYGYYSLGITPPIWQNQGQTKDIMLFSDINKTNNLYAQWMDANGLAYTWLETNETGQWKNQTPIQFASSFSTKNNNWNRCKNLTISNIFTSNSPVTVNITGLIFTNATKEIRIMNISCNNDGSQVEFDIIDDSGNIGDGSEWVRVVFPASNNTTYSVYYDNPSAVEDTSLRLEADDIWNNYYNTTITPSQAGWSIEAGSGATTAIVTESGQLRLNETTANQYINWIWFDSSLSSTGWTAEWSFKVATNPTQANKASGYFSLDDGSKQPAFYYNKTHIWHQINATETYAVDLTNYHSIRLMKNSTGYFVFIDNAYVGTATNPSANVNKYYNFLVYDVNQTTYWDYTTYSRTGGYQPASVSIGNEVSVDGWWDYAWQNRKSIKVISDGSSRIKEPVIANVTDITYTNITKEGRLFDAYGNSVKFDIIDQADNWVRIIFPYTGSTNQTFYFYYNNPSATENTSIRLSDYDIWNDYYNATVSPLSATLAWVNSTAGAVTQTVISDNGVQKLNISFGVNGYLHWSRSGSAEWSSLYILKIDPSTGTGSFSNPSGYISLQGGGKAFEFDFNKTHIWNAYVTTQIVEVPQFTQRYVVFQVNRSANSSANLFIDGQLAMNVAGSASAGTQIVFATGSGTTNGGIIYWDAVAYNTVSNTSSPLKTELGTEEFQWWNSSWLNRKKITVISDGTIKIKEPVVMNITGLTFANITKESRLVYNNQEALFDIIQNGSNWAKIIFPVNISNTNLTYYFYYNNPSADEPNHWLKNTSVWEEFYNASQLPSATFWKSELGAGAINTIQIIDGFSRLNVTAVGNAQYQGWYRQPAVTSSRTSEVAFRIDPASSNVQYLGYLVLVMGGGTANNGIQINFNKTHLYSTTGTYTECAVNLTANYVNIRSLINGTIYVNNTFCMNAGKFTNPNSQIYIMTRPSSGTTIVYWDYFGYNATFNSTPLTATTGSEETQWLWSNFTWLNNSAYGIIAWRIYANNSLGIENVTSIKTFIITVVSECNMTINYTSVSFGLVEHSTTNNPANNNYSVSANASQTCSCKISWNVPNPQLTYLIYTIGNQNLKLNWTQDGSPHNNLELRNLTVNVSVSNNTKSLIYPKYYLDVPYLQHTGDYQGSEIISSSCA